MLELLVRFAPMKSEEPAALYLAPSLSLNARRLRR